MATYAPESNLRLYKNVDITGGQQIAFQSRNAQRQYFQSKLISGAYLGNDLTYVRKTGQIKVDITPSVADTVDYLSFTNSNFENRTFYCKVVNWEYVNNAVCAFTYYIDYFQTYMFDFTMRSGKILREHLSTTEYEKLQADYLDMTVPEMFTQEPLAYGTGCEEMFSNNTGFDFTNVDYYLYLCVSQNPDGSAIESGTDAVPFQIRGFSLSSGFYKFPNNSPGMTSLKTLINEYVVNNNTSAILGLYFIPNGTIDETAASIIDLSNGIKDDPNVYNKKLLRYPYRYIRVLGSDGNIKEYQIEKFKANEQGKFKFKIYCDIKGVPIIVCSPYKYGHENSANIQNTNYNFDERIDCFQFPQMPYMTDGYLTYLASAYKNTLTSYTTEYTGAQQDAYNVARQSWDPQFAAQAARQGSQDKAKALIGAAAGGMYKEYPNAGASIAGVITDTATGAAGLLPAFAGDLGITGATAGLKATMSALTANALETKQTQNNFMRQAATGIEAGNFFADSAGIAMAAANGEYPSGNFSGARNAYVANNYHTGGADNYLAYANNDVYPQFQIVKLRDDLLKKYDDFLKLYGLCSERAGRPRIYNYIKNSSNQPKFIDSFTGMTGSFCYTVMENCRVTGINDTAAKFIETIFNSGCWFIKGESLL